jgi:hypothetical protein
MNKKNHDRLRGYYFLLVLLPAFLPWRAAAFQPVLPDTIGVPRIILHYDREASEKSQKYQDYFGFYNSQGALIHKMYRHQLPEKSPFRQIELPYYEENTKNINDVKKRSLQDTNLMYGYFDLSKVEYSKLTKYCRLLDPKIPDSIIKNSMRIYHSKPSQLYYSMDRVVTKSCFYWVNLSNYQIIWTTSYFSIYQAADNLPASKDFTISCPNSSHIYISNDLKYLLLENYLYYMHELSGFDGESMILYNIPLELVELETGKKVNIPRIYSGTSLIRPYNKYFHIVQTKGNTVHIVIDPTRNIYYIKEIEVLKDGLTNNVIDKLMLDLGSYNQYTIHFK